MGAWRSRTATTRFAVVVAAEPPERLEHRACTPLPRRAGRGTGPRVAQIRRPSSAVQEQVDERGLPDPGSPVMKTTCRSSLERPIEAALEAIQLDRRARPVRGNPSAAGAGADRGGTSTPCAAGYVATSRSESPVTGAMNR